MTVPYGRSRNFFYSGHAGFIVFFIQSVEYTLTKVIVSIILVYVITLFHITRVFHIIDVMGSTLFSILFYQLAQ